MEKGTENEPQARKLYEALFDVQAEQVGFITPDEDNEFFEWIGVSPDSLIGEDGGLEIKCPLRKTLLGYIKKNVLPSTYRHQVQSSLFISGRKWWDFMAYCEGMKPFIIRVYPDIELHKTYEKELRIAIIAIKKDLETYKKYSYE